MMNEIVLNRFMMPGLKYELGTKYRRIEKDGVEEAYVAMCFLKFIDSVC